jgi:hypothetical protein
LQLHSRILVYIYHNAKLIYRYDIY